MSIKLSDEINCVHWNSQEDNVKSNRVQEHDY